MDRKQFFARIVYGGNLKRTLLRATLLAATAYAVLGHCYSPTVLRGISMEPNCRDGQIGFIDKLRYRFVNPRAGDIVVIYTKGKKSYYLKRVLAVSGERVEFRNGDLYIEGKHVKEDYLPSKGMWSMRECVVPPGDYFVAGDNREVEIYNHRIGFVSRSKVAGGLILWRS